MAGLIGGDSQCRQQSESKRIEKAQRRAINPKLSEIARNRALNNIESLEKRSKKYRELHELLRENQVQTAKERLRQLKTQNACLDQILEVMTEQGLVPEQYMSRLEIGIRLSQKFRQN